MSNVTRREFVKRAGLTAAGTVAGTAAAPPPTTRARIALHKGVPALFIDDVPQPPLVYYLPVPVKEHIADFAEAGVSLYSWGDSTLIGNSRDMGWIGPGQYDYSAFDAEVQTILSANPKSYLFPRLAVSAPRWWLEQHPNERIWREDGTKTEYTSLASPLWKADASEALAHLIRHVREMPYANRFIGYQVTGGSNEWFYALDASPAALAGFRAWLHKRYDGILSALQEAWNRREVTFENVTIPGKDEYRRTDINLFRNPKTSRRCSDYFQFLSEATAEGVVLFCKAGKEASDNQSVMGAFYGYMINATGGYDENGEGAVSWGHEAFRKVVDSPYVDFLCAPYQYTHRGPGGCDGPQSLAASVKLHGKLWLTECDSPTFAVPVEEAEKYRGHPIPDRPQSFAILQRDFLHALTTRQGMWWMDLVAQGGWYHHPDVVRVIKRARKLQENAFAMDMHYQAEIAVIVDEETPYYLRPGIEILFPLVFLQDRLGLCRIGTTYDLYLHNDLERDEMPEYKMYVFLDTIYLTHREKEVIKRRVCRGNKVIVWMYGAGAISEDGVSGENVTELTGIHTKMQRIESLNHLLGARVYLTDFEHTITKGAESHFYFGTDLPVGPGFYVEDRQAHTLGRLLPSMSLAEFREWPGFAVKTFEDWTSIYIGAPNVPPDILRNIAKLAGCHVYNDDRDVIYANSHFLSIHTNRAGRKLLRLPRRTDVYDAFTEEKVASNAVEFADDLAQYATRAYFLGDIAQIANRETRIDPSFWRG
ncbi:MAG: beta-galactosidase [Bryobacteraceae bacterium]